MTLVERRLSSNPMRSLRGNNDDPSLSPILRVQKQMDQYNYLNAQLSKLRRKNSNASTISADSGCTPNQAELYMVNKQLERTRRESIDMISSHKCLLAKINKCERNPFFRIFTPRREKKVADMKMRLSVELTEAAKVDSEIENLERQSLRLTEICNSASSTPIGSLSSEEQRKQLLFQKKKLLNDIFQIVPVPDNLYSIRSLEALQISEVESLASIKGQIEELMCQYRHALHLLRNASAKVLSSDYQSCMPFFLNGPYPLALEASRIIDVASMMIQPECRRKYEGFADPLTGLLLPSFPSAMTELARPGALSRTKLSPEDIREKLLRSEETVIRMQEAVSTRIEILSRWMEEVDEDHSDAEARRLQLSRQVEKCTDQFIHEVSRLGARNR